MPRRTTLIIVGAVTALIVLVVAAVLLYVNVWSAPTKHDFEQAKFEVNTLETRYNDLATALQLYSGSIKDTKPGEDKVAKASYDKAVNAVNDSFRTLDQTRAVRDSKVRRAYDPLVKKQQIIQSYSDGFIEYRKSFALCIDVFNVANGQTDPAKLSAAHKKAAADCLPVLTLLKHSRISFFADYGKNYLAGVQKRQTVFDDYAHKRISESEASAKIADIAHIYLTHVFRPGDGLAKAQQSADASIELKQLTTTLDQKIKQP